jgi:drug/metabolite transporter (DMT)-like permease
MPSTDTPNRGTRSVITRPDAKSAPTWLVLTAFAAVYVLWGSTYFAIRVGVESFPPYLMAGLRHFTVGLVFYPAMRRLTGEKPGWPQWRTAIVTGVLLLAIANGTVSWAERLVPSGVTALLVSTVSLWMVLIEWLRPGGQRPGPRVIAGFVLGFAGMILLVGPAHIGSSERVHPLGAFALLAASFAWALGSIYSRQHAQPKSPLLGVGMQTLSGGAALFLIAIATGETRHFHLADVTMRSWLAVFYLAVFGSALGFSAYVYILKYSTASRVATYAYVNPVVALFLGWSLGGEVITLRTLLASGVILAAVLLVVTVPRRNL